MTAIPFGKRRNASISLWTLASLPQWRGRPVGSARLAGVSSPDNLLAEDSWLSALAEVRESRAEECLERIGTIPGASIHHLAGHLYSLRVPLGGLGALVELIQGGLIRRFQTKKAKWPSLDRATAEIGLIGEGGDSLGYDGSGVFLGVVDSGFDLSHPMFRDAGGALRVESLLDQSDGDRSYTRAQLEEAWQGGRGPGSDEDGHGTHVASIAAGSQWGQLRGVAPGADLLLVKTDKEMLHTSDAIKWVFDQAGTRPCVVNISLGTHFGPHDGSTLEEQTLEAFAAPGKIIVTCAGNERETGIHVGADFLPDRVFDVPFELQRRDDGSAIATITTWHHLSDKFDVTLITPYGEMEGPPLNKFVWYENPGLARINYGRQKSALNDMMQGQIELFMTPMSLDMMPASAWRLRIHCRSATVGRFDAWFVNKDFGHFLNSPLIDTGRSVCQPGTSAGCITFASHAGALDWTGDHGHRQDLSQISGRSSSSSGIGPTRDGRWKPEISAPGRYITAALANNATKAQRYPQFTNTAARTLTLEGTSMATPLVAGAVALLLQKDPSLDLQRVIELFERHAHRDQFTGSGRWSPLYGFGKLRVDKLLAAL